MVSTAALATGRCGSGWARLGACSGLLVAALCGTLAGTATAAPMRRAQAPLAPSYAESFRVGTSGPICEAQTVSGGAARGSVFDRRWALLCREVARPIGAAAFVRTGEVPAGGEGLEEALDCGQTSPVALAGLGGV